MDVTDYGDTGLGAMLRVWRDRLSPSAVGLPALGTRRTLGLRREELSELAGISVDYLVRLEQGRAERPSTQVVASLARALHLTGSERNHLYRLARLAPPTDADIPDHVPPGVQRILNRLGDVAVAVFAADWQIIWWNRSWAALLGDPSASPLARRNFARDCFPTGDDPPGLSHWPVISHAHETVEAAIVSDLRRATGRFPNNGRLTSLIQMLGKGNQRFAELWASGAVDAHREERKLIQHPSAGAISVDCDVLADGDTELKIVLLTAAPDTEDDTKLRLAMASDGVCEVRALRRPSISLNSCAGH